MLPEIILIKVPLKAMILIYIATWSNTSMITTILLFISWTAILLWENHWIVFIIKLMMECFFEVIDDVTDMLQDLTCATGFNMFL